MALDLCILAKAEAGLVSKTKARQLAKEIQERVKEAAEDGAISGPEAERVIANRVLEEKLRTLARKKKMARDQKRIQGDIQADFEKAISQGYGVDVAMKGRLSFDPTSRYTGPSVDSRVEVIRGQMHAAMRPVLEEFRSKYAGLTRDLSSLDDTIREMFGVKTGNEKAAALGKALTAATEKARARYNAAGGDIVERENWGFFQTHDASRISAVTKDEWVDFVIENLDIARMRDVNGLPMTAKQVRAALNPLYDSIASRGLKDIADVPGPKTHASNINVRANSRFLVFKDADAWLAYQKKFGTGNLYEHVVTSIDRMARDTGILEVLGPYPEATLRLMEKKIDEGFARDAISKTGKAAAAAAGKIGSPKSQLKALYNTVTGRTGITANEKFSLWSGAVRNVMTAAALGGAFLSAIADIPLQGITARMNGMAPWQVWKRMAKTFVLNSDADRRLAINVGFTAQGWASRAIGSQRVLGESIGSRWTELLTDTVLRASFLSPWTESGRFAFQTEFLSFISAQSAKNFDELPGMLQRSFQRHGITEADWKIIQATEQWVDEGSGASFIRAEDVMGDAFEGPQFEAANKLQEAIVKEMEWAVPGSNPRVRAALTGGAPPGTIWGEIMRSAAMFKTFPISIQALHWQRLAMSSGAKTKAEYAAWLIVGMTAMGAIGEQATAISRGRDPESLESPSFWARASMRGGAFGMLGDFLLQDHNGFGGGMDTLLGPIFGLISQGTRLTAGNIQELLSGEDTNAGRELSRFVEQNTPGRSIWYTRLALERLLFDQLDRALDPQSSRQFAKMERKFRKERGQQFFSRPGKGVIPQRAPDLSQAFEEAR